MSIFNAIALFMPSSPFSSKVPIYGMSLQWNTNVNIILLCISVPTNIWVSYLSDNMPVSLSRWGKRKPFVAVAGLLVPLSSLMFAFPQRNDNPNTLKVWYLLSSLVNTIAFCFFQFPFKAWLMESCRNSSEYTTVNGVLMVAGIIGALVAQLLLSAQGSLEKPLFYPQLAAALFIGLLLPNLVSGLYLIPQRALTKMPVQPPIISSFRSCIRTKEFKQLFKNEVLLQIAFFWCSEEFESFIEPFIYQIIYLFFGFQHTADVQKYFQPLFMVILGGNLISIVTLSFFLKRFEKLTVYRVLMLLQVVAGIAWSCMLIPGLIEYNRPGTYSSSQAITFFYCFLLLFCINSFIVRGIDLIKGLFVRDLIVFDMFVEKSNRATMYQTALSVPAQLVVSVVTNLPVGILYSTGFHANPNVYIENPLIRDLYDWNYGSLVQCFVYLLFFSTVVVIGAYWVMSDYALTTKIVDQMEVVNKKRDEKAAIEPSSNIASKSAAGASGSLESSNPDDVENTNHVVSPNFQALSVVQMTPEEEGYLMNHFSAMENRAMARNRDVNGNNGALQSITFSNRLSGLILGPMAMIALLTAVAYEFVRDEVFVTLTLNAFLAVSIYVGYELFRRFALNKLRQMPADEVRGLAERKKIQNEQYSSNLQNLLDINAIDEDPVAETGVIGRISSLGSKSTGRMSLAIAAPEEHEDEPLSGYKRVYLLLCALIVIGILLAAIKI